MKVGDINAIVDEMPKDYIELLGLNEEQPEEMAA